MYKIDFKSLTIFGLFFFFSNLAYCQLASFTLNVTKTNETCTANGTLNFTVANTTAGATMVYTIYQLPNLTTPISVQNTTSFSGLVAGTYRVVATQSLGSLTNSQQQDITIVNQIVLLTYSLSGNNEICGADGSITVNTLTGTAVSYEIFAGPIVRPLQPSNVFTGLIAGQYSVRVFDACGEGVVQTFTVLNTPADLGIAVSNTIDIISCTLTKITISIQNIPNSVIVYPLQITISVNPPSGGAPIVYNQTITSSNNLQVMQDIILYPNQYYTYNISVLDGCGNTYIRNGVEVNSSTVPLLTFENLLCNNRNIVIINAVSAVLINGPSGLPYVLPYTLTANSVGYFVLFTSLPGTYTFTTVDKCGVIRNQVITLADDNGFIFVSPAVGCSSGLANLLAGVYLQTAILIQAPPSYPATLPLNLTSSISNGSFTMVDIPLGIYIFNLTDACGNTSNVTVNANVGHIQNIDIDIIENCGSFDIYLNHTTNSSINNVNFYWLQQYNPVTNQWFNPSNGVVYTGGVLFSNNAIPLINQATNYNFAFLGHFRILTSFSSATTCINVLHEFDYDGLPKINDVYSFLCNNGTYDVFVDAVGLQPLIYRITQKNGLPFSIQNGNSSVFLGLPAAVYNFQVEDACGNILNSLFEVPRPFNFAITPIGFCNGQPGSLTLPNFSIFQYEWWKDNATTTILSTTNTLEFPTFNSVTDVGVYHVRVRYTGNPNSCIDFTLDYTISTNAFNPNAGQNNAITYCGNPNNIDLFSLILGSYDTGGTWQEISSSGMLTNNIWNATNVPSGIYNFKYKVTGLCNTFDEATITITIKSLPSTPIASVDPIVCDSNTLNLFATPIPNSIYNWSGPNGFSSTDQNPTINTISNLMNGTYTVNVIQDGCVSGSSSVNVLVNPLPNFAIESACLSLNFVLTATPIQNSFESSSVSYNWTGPNGFSAIGNPIQITGGERGLYYATITDANGCSATQFIDVQTTFCEIPNVISPNNDGYNDSLDLIGLDVVNLQIFSRWGRLVYEKANYLDEWYGQNNNGGELPDATYFYFAQLKTGETKRGWILVFR
jgi:gliding motility-associated-like protein